MTDAPVRVDAAECSAGHVDRGVQLRIDGPRATLTLYRPAQRNALGERDWTTLRDALADVEGAAGCRVLILRGEGGSFASGAHLDELVALRREPARLREFYRTLRATLEHLWRLPIPTVAAIDGPCHGAGLSLAVACDLRVATGRSTFSAPTARLGLLYSQPEVARLRALIGPGAARDMLFTARQCTAAEAHRIRLVEQLVAEQDLDAAVAATCVPLETLSAHSIREHKRTLLALDATTVEDGRAEAAFFGEDAERAFATRAARAVRGHPHD